MCVCVSVPVLVLFRVCGGVLLPYVELCLCVLCRVPPRRPLAWTTAFFIFVYLSITTNTVSLSNSSPGTSPCGIKESPVLLDLPFVGGHAPVRVPYAMVTPALIRHVSAATVLSHLRLRWGLSCSPCSSSHQPISMVSSSGPPCISTSCPPTLSVVLCSLSPSPTLTYLGLTA